MLCYSFTMLYNMSFNSKGGISLVFWCLWIFFLLVHILGLTIWILINLFKRIRCNKSRNAPNFNSLPTSELKVPSRINKSVSPVYVKIIHDNKKICFFVLILISIFFCIESFQKIENSQYKKYGQPLIDKIDVIFKNNNIYPDSINDLNVNNMGNGPYYKKLTIANILFIFVSDLMNIMYIAHKKKNGNINTILINYKPLWDKTTDDYKSFNLKMLLYYTKKETGRNIVDRPYRQLYNKYCK